MDKYLEIKADFDALLSCVQEHCPDVQRDSVENYFVSAILKAWGSNLSYAPDYALLLEAVIGKRYTIEQIVTAMGCCGDPERHLKVPGFIRESVSQDVKDNGNRTAKQIRMLNDLLVASAMVNGDFTTEEANAIAQTVGELVSFARNAGVPVSALDNMGKVTPRDESSYLQNDALLSAARQRNTDNGKPFGTSERTSTPNRTVSPVTININMTSEDKSVSRHDSSETNVSDVSAIAPEESPVVSTPDEEGGETMESLLAELDGLVGLDNVKRDVHSLMNFIKVTRIREQRGKKVPTVSYHLVFTGNPGTGKTTIARLVAKLYYHIGILPQGQLVETDRSALVAGYLGQTSIKTQKVIQQAMGGVLFIDEAYALVGDTEDSYGKEAIETILKAMEDHRGELVVIVAGYTELMHKFIESNPGLSSRFSKYFEFADYSGEELLAIFNRFCDKNGYTLDDAAAVLLGEHFAALYEKRDEHFGNARTARNIFEKAINAQADRIAVQADISDDDLERISVQDINAAIGDARP